MPQSAPPSPTSAPATGQPSHETVDFDHFVDRRIEQTRRGVVLADLAVAGATLLAGGLVLLLVAALLEHWVVPGGLGQNQRAALWGIGLIGAGAYATRRVMPLLTRRVNPLYAADELERDAPELKNSLLNLLQLRGEQNLPTSVRTTLEHQAAERLAGAHEHGVDLAPLVRIGYVLLTLVAVVGLYVVLSPKDFLTTAQRVILPWAEVAAPSRVLIEDLKPGDLTLLQGEKVTISARITGKQEDDRIELVYSTADGQARNRRLPLRPDGTTSRYTTMLPAEDNLLGLQSEVRYRIEAGDARTRDYTVTVQTTPTIAPLTVHYDYPDYTRFVDRRAEGIGDLRAIEGTHVTLTAEANQTIDSAQVDLGADGRPDLRMRVSDHQATAKWTLRRKAGRGLGPEVSNYTIRFTTTGGQANRSPPRYQIEVLADLPPEASLLLPEEPIVTVRAEESVEVVVEARDPDFALGQVRLVGEVAGKRVLDTPLYVAKRTGAGHQGRFSATYRVVPSRLGLSGGETLDYWAEVADNRQPEPNRARSTKKQLRVLADERDGKPDEQASPEQQPDDGNQQPGKEGQPSNDPQQQGAEQGEPSDDQQQTPDQTDPEQGKGDSSNKETGGLQGKGEQTPDAKSSESEGGAGTAGEAASDSERGQGPSGNNPSDTSPEDGDRSDPTQQEEGGTEQRRPGEPTGGESRPVARDGSDDGSAFEQIQKHLEQSKNSKEGEQKDPSDERTESNDNRSESEPGERTVDAHPKEGDSDGQSSEVQEQPSESQEAEPDTNEQPRDATSPDPERNGSREPEGDRRSGEQSDSQSSESGGDATPGQENQPSDSPREGIGSSGENQAADDGTGQSADHGPGDTTGRSGGQQASDSSSDGQQSEPQEGGSPDGERTGSGRPAGEPGNESGNERGKDPSGDGQPSEEGSPEGNPGNPPADPNRSGDPQGPTQGGDRGPTDFERPQVEAPEPGGDEANLDYARRQTDLVLDKLSEQLARREVDRELLEKLGWSEEDLRRFVARWQERKQRAAANPQQGETELDNALRSLGLGQRGVLETTSTQEDALRDLRQGRRSTIPPALRERLEHYNRGVNAAGE